MANPLSESVWDADIEEAILSLSSGVVCDHAYWHRTVDRVEAGLDPEKTQTLTMTALKAWVTRCKSAKHSVSTTRVQQSLFSEIPRLETNAQTQEAPLNDRKTRRVSPENGHVPNS